VIVADTGAILALVDADDRHHESLTTIYLDDPDAWVLPWAILPEVDYLLANHVSDRAARAFLQDLARGRYAVAWGTDADLDRAHAVAERHRGLKLGLVDGAVIAVAERLRASAIATLDLRHFSAVTIKGAPRLLPRDLPS
jgi:uncharacterized protein